MSERQNSLAACADYADRLVDLSDGELPAGERTDVEAHVADCAACREQLRRLNASLAALRAGITAAAPADIRRQLPASRRTLWLAAGSTAAAILLAVGIGSLSAPTPIVQVNTPQTPTATITTDDALRRIAMLEQQARLETSLALLPDDPWFADRRAANERLLSTYRAAAAAITDQPPTPSSKETL